MENDINTGLSNLEQKKTIVVLPYRCPICFGKGIVPLGFYDLAAGYNNISTGAVSENCRACNGQGILWN